MVSSREIPSFKELLWAYFKEEREREDTHDPLVAQLDTVRYEPFQQCILGERLDGEQRYIAEAAFFGKAVYSGGECLLLTTAAHLEDSGWSLQQLSEMHLASNDPRLKSPILRMGLTGSRRVVVGMLGLNPQIKSMRLTLSNGESYESEMKNNSALLFVPFQLSQQTAREGKFEILDRFGTVVATDLVAVLSSGDSPNV